jgi:hypothetical protein
LCLAFAPALRSRRYEPRSEQARTALRMLFVPFATVVPALQRRRLDDPRLPWQRVKSRRCIVDLPRCFGEPLAIGAHASILARKSREGHRKAVGSFHSCNFRYCGRDFPQTTSDTGCRNGPAVGRMGGLDHRHCNISSESGWPSVKRLAGLANGNRTALDAIAQEPAGYLLIQYGRPGRAQSNYYTRL